MFPVDSIAGRRSELNELIASDNLSRATVLLMDFTRDFSDKRDDVNRAIIIRSSFTRVKKREQEGLLNYDEAEKRKVQLLYQMLSFMDELEDEFIRKSKKMTDE
ncbi:MAG: hypothetical protein AAFY48_22320 [Bacteroidota bacterium]